MPTVNYFTDKTLKLRRFLRQRSFFIWWTRCESEAIIPQTDLGWHDLTASALTRVAKNMPFLHIPQRKNPVRGGYLTGLIGGGNEGKEETSFLLRINIATTMPFRVDMPGYVSCRWYKHRLCQKYNYLQQVMSETKRCASNQSSGRRRFPWRRSKFIVKSMTMRQIFHSFFIFGQN